MVQVEWICGVPPPHIRSVAGRRSSWRRSRRCPSQMPITTPERYNRFHVSIDPAVARFALRSLPKP